MCRSGLARSSCLRNQPGMSTVCSPGGSFVKCSGHYRLGGYRRRGEAKESRRPHVRASSSRPRPHISSVADHDGDRRVPHLSCADARTRTTWPSSGVRTRRGHTARSQRTHAQPRSAARSRALANRADSASSPKRSRLARTGRADAKRRAADSTRSASIGTAGTMAAGNNPLVRDADSSSRPRGCAWLLLESVRYGSPPNASVAGAVLGASREGGPVNTTAAASRAPSGVWRIGRFRPTRESSVRRTRPPRMSGSGGPVGGSVRIPPPHSRASESSP